VSAKQVQQESIAILFGRPFYLTRWMTALAPTLGGGSGSDRLRAEKWEFAGHLEPGFAEDDEVETGERFAESVARGEQEGEMSM
jgi:hypothetical protein